MCKMKDSGIEWIGEIPIDWKIVKYKYFAQSGMGLTILKTDIGNKGVPIYSATQSNNIFGYINNPQLILTYGDLIIPARGNSIGYATYISEEMATCTQTTIYSKIKNINKRFMYYCCYGLKDQWFNFEDTAIPQITVGQVQNNPVPIPPISLQSQIADFLDNKFSQIDRYIEKQQQIIEKLKEYKQAIITEAVTKGLDPDVKMKDSGIEWIGEIPEHWETPEIKYIARIGSGGTPDRNHPEYWNGDIPWIKTGELQNDIITNVEEYITEIGLSNSSAQLFNEDTILIAMYGQGKTRGMTALLRFPASTNQACAALTVTNKDIITEYLWQCLIGAYHAIRAEASGSGQPNLSATIIGNFHVAMPPLDEQKNIVKYIKSRTTEISVTISQAQNLLNKLTEYKKSLIYEAVTGKLDIV